MSIQTGATRVVDTVNDAVEKIGKAVDEVSERVKTASDGTLNRIGRVHTQICDPLEQANTKLDELLGSNFPPD